MSESIEERLARIGDEAEAGELDQTPRPMPPGVKVSRPNKAKAARGKVLQIRFTDNEFESLEAIAARHGLPVSVFARDELLGAVAQGRTDTPDVVALLDSLVVTADRLRAVVTVSEAEVHIPPVSLPH